MLLIVPEAKKGLPTGCFQSLNCTFLIFLTGAWCVKIGQVF